MTDLTPDVSTPHRQAFLAWTIDLFLVAAFVALIYHTLVFTHQTLATDEFWSDLISLAQPTYEYTGKSLAAGELPLWNPYWFSGYPHLAMPSAGAFYPTTILFGIWPFTRAIKTVVLLHCFLAGAFSYALGRNVIGGRVPALYLAFIAIAGDMVLPWIRNGQIWTLLTLTWFPLAVLLVHRLSGKGRWGSVVGLGVVMALMVFGGDPQALAFCLWFLAPYTAALFCARFWANPSKWRGALVQMAFCLSGILLGMSMAGIQLLPSRELYSESIRAHGLTYEYLRLGYFPKVLKSFAWLEADDEFSLTAACRVVIALAVAGLVFTRGAATKAAGFGALVCLLYILMPRWFYDAIVQHLPVYTGVRGAFRMSVMLWWVVAYLSAFGVAAWLSTIHAPPRRRLLLAVVTLLALACVVLLPIARDQSIPAVRAVSWALGGLGLCVVLGQKWIGRAWIAGPVLVLAAVGVELDWRAETVNTSGDPGPYAVNAEFMQYSSSRRDMDRIALLPAFRLRHGTAVGMFTGDRVLQGYHGLLLTRFGRLFRDAADVPVAPMDKQGRLEKDDFVKAPHLSDYITEKTVPLLELLNVHEVVAYGNQNRLPDSLVEPQGPFTQLRQGDLIVYRNARALPPVFPIHEIVVSSSDDEALALMHDRRIDFHRQATITAPFDASELQPAVAPEQIAISQHTPQRIVATVELSAPAVVVFSEVYYPGWRALVDGQARDVLCVNTVVRGVRVDAGKHEVVLVYAPRSLVYGSIATAAASVVALMLLAVFAWEMLRKRSAATPA